MQEIDDFIQNATQLPPAPHTLVQLLRLSDQPDVDTGKVVELISYEPALTARVLQIANSPYFAGSEAVTHTEEAVQRLGMQPLYRIVAGICGSQFVAAVKPGWGIDSAALWRHSVASALAAQITAREVDGDPNAAFTAGLLHDLGKIVLACAMQNIYAAVATEAEREQTLLLAAERRRLGVDHAEVGGRLLTRWKLPAALVAAVAYHHQPDAAGEHGRATACVTLANTMAQILGYRSGQCGFSFHGQAEALALLGLNAHCLPHLLIQVLETASMMEALLGLGAGGQV